jgi:hypothetical protein
MKAEEIKNELVKRGFQENANVPKSIYKKIGQFVFEFTIVDDSYYFLITGLLHGLMINSFEMPFERIQALVFGLTGERI